MGADSSSISGLLFTATSGFGFKSRSSSDVSEMKESDGRGSDAGPSEVEKISLSVPLILGDEEEEG